ncbi:proline-rich protein 2 isoform X2 [Fundulus heteroclitus]|uniref:proline-rich protein 2 isoform X2 n=1 Tax=Fundulus heteroclitus TaxID=8078 RepID=UPI00165CDBFD|nr:proline-rich protein 2 isoform X2 [Fundulus heteroclitus]
MGFLLRLLVVSVLAVGTSKVYATHMLSMPEPDFPTRGLSKPLKLPEKLSYPLWFSMAPLYLPQQNPDINRPRYPVGGPVPRAQPPMLPVEPKYPIGGPVQQPQFPGWQPCSTGPCRLPMFPVEPRYPIGGPVSQAQPPMLSVEPKYPIGGPIPQAQPPMLPVEPKYPIGGPVQQPQFPGWQPCSTGPCRLPMFPVEPRYPIGGPVSQAQPPMLPVEPKYPIGGPVQQPQFPGKHPCSRGNPVGSCAPPMFHVNPNYPFESPSTQRLSAGSKYPVEGPMGHGLLSFMFNLEPGKDLNDHLHHGYPPRSPDCESKWPFLPSKPCS